MRFVCSFGSVIKEDVFNAGVTRNWSSIISFQRLKVEATQSVICSYSASYVTGRSLILYNLHELMKRSYFI